MFTKLTIEFKNYDDLRIETQTPRFRVESLRELMEQSRKGKIR